MATPVWKPGTLYNPGAIVRRASASPVIAPTITNPSFESGDSGWTKGTGWAIVLGTTVGGAPTEFDGAWTAQFTTVVTDSYLENDALVPVSAGRRVRAQCMVRQGDSNGGVAGARVLLAWYDINEVLISRSLGTLIDAEPQKKYVASVVTGTAPANTAFMKIGAVAFRNNGAHPLWVDTFTWDYSYQDVNANLVFRAVQPNAGFSDAIEPVWPNVNGQQVIDNEVIWEAITSSRVVWEANPILVSGYDEPLWPLDIGGEVADNTIAWRAISRRVLDEKCPNTEVVAIAASKIFCGDDDIIGFSATVNPLDWTTEEDAGYLPFGLQTFGANPVTALGLYRTNLVAFNSAGYQMWQIDEDPANMAILDSAPVGCVWPKTVLPVQNDLVFLSAVGVRNISIAGGSTNLQAGTFGEAIDPLVLAKLKAGEFEPFGLFVPGFGQYWLFFGDEAFVLTITDVKKMSWSRYTFPEEITDWTLENNDLLVRTATHKVWRFSTDALMDDEATSTFDMPYLPEGMTTGTLEIDANYVRDRTSSTGGNFVPNSYGGNPVVFDPPAYALVLQAMSPGAGDLECVINGLDENGDPVSETITFDGSEEYRYRVGTQLFSQIDDIDQTGNTADQFFSVGYQRYIEDAEAEELTVTVHGYWTISDSSDPTGNRGLFVPEVDTPQVLPATSVLVVRHNENQTTTERVYVEDSSGASVTLPAGAIGRVVVGTEELDEILFMDRTGSGGVTPFVDIGIQFTAGPTGEVFDGTVWWPYLDFNTLGVEKMFVGLDLVATAPGGVAVSIGYDQRVRASRTADYEMEPDTLPGQMVPIPCAGPSFDLRLTFHGGEGKWEWNAAVLYVKDMRVGA